jgi:hypothetical protein
LRWEGAYSGAYRLFGTVLTALRQAKVAFTSEDRPGCDPELQRRWVQLLVV